MTRRVSRRGPSARSDQTVELVELRVSGARENQSDRGRCERGVPADAFDKRAATSGGGAQLPLNLVLDFSERRGTKKSSGGILNDLVTMEITQWKEAKTLVLKDRARSRLERALATFPPLPRSV